MIVPIRFAVFLLYCGIFLIKFDLSPTFLLFVVGGAIGLHLFEAERVLRLHIDSGTRWSLKEFRNQLRHKTNSALAIQRILFVLYPLIAVFIVTSTGSVIGAGLVLGLGFRYAWELVRTLSHPVQMYRTYLQHWLSRQPSEQTLHAVAVAYIIAYAVFSIMILV